MSKIWIFIFPVILGFFLACVAPQVNQVQVPPEPKSTPTVSETTSPPAPPSVAGAVSAALPHLTDEQSKMLLDNLSQQLPNLDKASNDMMRFCPHYLDLPAAQRVIAWGHLASAILSFESGTNSKGLINTCSSMTESTGIDSIGFFQLSYGDKFCPHSRDEANLCDVSVNIACATKIMGLFVSQDKAVAGGGYTAYGAAPAEGLARYWSVIRVPDPKPHTDKNGKKVQSAHHLTDIMNLTSKAPGCK